MPQDRKTLIADAAIALLGETGARGLTHRAVDAKAGLPEGSTSFYCRSKLDLWRVALARHADLDAADLADDGMRMAASSASAAFTREALIDLLVHRVEDWSAPAKRARLVARFELFLVASREPELAAFVQAQRERFHFMAEEALRGARVPSPERVAPLVIMAMDGLLLDRARGVGAGHAGAEAVRHLLAAVLGAAGHAPTRQGARQHQG